MTPPTPAAQRGRDYVKGLAESGFTDHRDSCLAFLAHVDQLVEDLWKAEATIGAREATIMAAVYCVGGLVEGNPTGRHNFLQRIDELLKAEADLVAYREAFDTHAHQIAALTEAAREYRSRACVFMVELGQEDEETEIQEIDAALAKAGIKL